MPRMNVHREPDGLTGQGIIGPCPGCDLWTVQYVRFELPPGELIDIIEALLQEHLLECPGLQEIVANTR